MKNALQFVRTALAPLALVSAPLSRFGFAPLALVPMAFAACVAPIPELRPGPNTRVDAAITWTSEEGREDFTVYDLLTDLGVFFPNPATHSVEVERTLNGESFVIPVDFAKIHAGDSSSNILLRSGDIVRISSAR